MKNPHAVKLGRAGGLKGGPAGGRARAAALSPERRKEIARVAAAKRWAGAPLEMVAFPEYVTELLKSYDVAALDWMRRDDRYAIVREVLRKGSTSAKRWLAGRLSEKAIRELIQEYRGAGLNEPERKSFRRRFGLTKQDIPEKAYLGFEWAQ